MKILFKIEDDWVLASEEVELTLEDSLFDLSSWKQPKSNKYLLAICRNVARLRGHDGRYNEIKILKINGR